jgi:hypothetical protein
MVMPPSDGLGPARQLPTAYRRKPNHLTAKPGAAYGADSG